VRLLPNLITCTALHGSLCLSVPSFTLIEYLILINGGGFSLLSQSASDLTERRSDRRPNIRSLHHPPTASCTIDLSFNGRKTFIHGKRDWRLSRPRKTPPNIILALPTHTPPVASSDSLYKYMNEVHVLLVLTVTDTYRFPLLHRLSYYISPIGILREVSVAFLSRNCLQFVGICVGEPNNHLVGQNIIFVTV
jgi:hypothetical protein